MRLRLLNLAYLVAAIIATGWVLSDLYFTFVLNASQGTTSSEGTFAALLNIPILAGVLILLFTFYRYPTRTRNQESQKAAPPPPDQPSKSTSRETQPSRVKPARKVSAEDSEKSVNTDSTTLSMDSTTLDVDDFFQNPPKDDDLEEMYVLTYDGAPSGHSGKINGNSLEPQLEAEVLTKFHRNDHALAVLIDAFNNKHGNCDEIATQALSIIDNELDRPSTSSQRAYHLELKRGELANRFIKARRKLSDEALEKIHSGIPIKPSTKDSGSREAFQIHPGDNEPLGPRF